MWAVGRCILDDSFDSVAPDMLFGPFAREAEANAWARKATQRHNVPWNAKIRHSNMAYCDCAKCLPGEGSAHDSEDNGTWNRIVFLVLQMRHVRSAKKGKKHVPALRRNAAARPTRRVA